MRIMKRTGRYLAAICFSVLMAVQPAAVKADEEQQTKELNVVYYNQADYPGEKIGGSTIFDDVLPFVEFVIVVTGYGIFCNVCFYFFESISKFFGHGGC